MILHLRKAAGLNRVPQTSAWQAVTERNIEGIEDWTFPAEAAIGLRRKESGVSDQSRTSSQQFLYLCSRAASNRGVRPRMRCSPPIPKITLPAGIMGISETAIGMGASSVYTSRSMS